jgi:hypothetical protein
MTHIENKNYQINNIFHILKIKSKNLSIYKIRFFSNIKFKLFSKINLRNILYQIIFLKLHLKISIIQQIY